MTDRSIESVTKGDYPSKAVASHESAGGKSGREAMVPKIDGKVRMSAGLEKNKIALETPLNIKIPQAE